MIEKKVTVRNQAGIHCRPSSIILMALQEFPDCRVRIKSKKGDSDLTSILSLISLGLEKGDEVTVIAEGQSEEKACSRIAELFAYEFDFPPREEQENVNVFA
ncbi:MAG TPA: HPr family phosphocarrier protein [Victivallales bacterium]|nr:HPr family phosphocarrier protein [Victivallales bacterium]HRR29345.1 HPr family phosphocarrier protein [Victivallales bacterium]